MAEEDKEDLDEIAGKTVWFRVFSNIDKVDNTTYTILIARPIPILAQDIRELLFHLFFWLLLCTISVVTLSYSLAGKILKPIQRINHLIKEINDVSLDKRIPVGENLDELNTLSLSLNSMFDRLQYSFNRQKEFIGNASHELKSPLTILMLGHEKILSEPITEIARVI